MEKDELLQTFGNALMKSVRDPAIVASRMILDGSSKADEDRVFTQFVSGLSIESRQQLEQLITKTIDLTIFNFLSFFEQQQEFLLAVRTVDEDVDLCVLSEGLAGELWGDDGWIEQFSYPDNYLGDN